VMPAFCCRAIITGACWGLEKHVMASGKGWEEPTNIVHKVCGRALVRVEKSNTDPQVSHNYI
jgi:hypothetical protein